MTIPEPADGSRVVVDAGDHVGRFTDQLRLYWRDDAASSRWNASPGERWFASTNTAPFSWAVATRYAEKVFLVDNEPWKPLAQPDDPDRVAVRLFVEGVIRDVVFDRSEYEQAKADDKLDHLVDVYVSDMDGDSYVVEADGAIIRPF